jgi:flagellar M-ring protein FliF
MVSRLTALAPAGSALADGSGAPFVAGGAFPAVSAPTGMMALPGPGGSVSAANLEEDAMISLGQVEGEMRASSLRRLSDIVGKHPDETLTIMRGWMAQENG